MPQWKIKEFNSLNTKELYEIMKRRFEVFVLEQDCKEQDFDNYDQLATHLFAIKNEEIIAYCRLFKANVKYKEPSIGRVLVTVDNRNRGLATEMMERAIKQIEENWQERVIKVQAQAHLESMYGALGFVRVSDVYDSVGIPHIDMLKTSK